ncbi:MAG: hypothetical protein ABI824_18640 [Acidobacteriota bacterium]
MPNSPESEDDLWLGTILKMRGLGAGMWSDEDLDEYVLNLRSPWGDTKEFAG